MEDRRKTRSDDDVPIIGDYSDAHDARMRPAAARPETAAPAASRPGPAAPDARASRRDNRARDDRLLIDPSDMQRHARLARQRERPRSGKLRVLAPIAVAAAVAGLVYWNFDTLRGITFDFSEITDLFASHTPGAGGEASSSGRGLETAPVESQAVAGAAVATSLSDARPAAPPSPEPTPAAASAESPAEQAAADSTAAPARPGDEQLASLTPPASQEPPRPATEEPAPPAPPPEPETFEFGLSLNSVSEGDPAAALLILRNGDKRSSSSVTWWTSPGTATAGSDYVDLGKVEVKFAPSEQNRTIRIPIVGDRVVEGPESFYVHLGKTNGQGELDELAKTEVVINDDD